MVICWTHKKKVIPGILYCPDCKDYITAVKDKIMRMKKDELLDYGVKIGLSRETTYKMTINKLRTMILNHLNIYK